MTSRQLPSHSKVTRFGGISSDQLRWVTWWSIGLLIAMLVTTALVSRSIDGATRKISGRAMRMILDGNVARFHLHIEQLQKSSEQMASDPVVEALFTEAPNSVVASNQRDVLAARMKRGRGLLRPVIRAWVITDASGKVLASDDDGWIGRDCGWADTNFRQLQGQQSTLVLPNEIPTSDRLVLLSLSPIVHDFEFDGTIGWVFDPRCDLSDRLPNTPTESVFLFDDQARMLTRSRGNRAWPAEVPGFESAGVPEVESAGDPEVESDVQNWKPVSLRVPDDSSGRPLTMMAEQAIRGSSGFDTDGYLDHRGVDVIAAWRWMPQYRLGMAVEADMSEALFPVRMLRYLMTGLIASVIASGFGIAALVARSKRLLNQYNDDESEVRRLGQYELIELLGVGGMGSVYRGRHEFLRRDVAIKVLEGEQLSKQAVTRFRREVQSTSKLRHPNTIAIYDYGQAESLSPVDIRKSGIASKSSKRDTLAGAGHPSDGQQDDSAGVFYYVMEYVDGITLQQLIDYYGPQSPERTVHLLLQVCGSIAEAHQSGLIHRDIKPGNILLCAESNSYDHIKVLDFGLVKDINATDTVAVTMTRSDSITGTPLYMAPETIRDATKASPSGDLYSIGAVGYALLTGKPTYEGESAIDLCLKQLEEVPISPNIRLGRSLPQGLQDCIMSCLSLDANERPRSIGELVKQLDSLPESAGWNQVDSVAWWENVFEANRQRAPVETKSDTVADRPLEGAS